MTDTPHDALGLETLAIHAGSEHARSSGAVTTPIFQSSTFLTDPASTSYEDVRYIRLNNTPNHEVLHARLAALERGEQAIVTSSGMAAISVALLSFLKSGDHMLATSCLYGGTIALMVDELAAFGIKVDFIDGDASPAQWREALEPTTRLLWTEPLSNPLLTVPDLAALRDFASAHDLIAILDNTFCSPVNFQPIPFGFDLCVHSATKYLNGHSDIVAGCIIGASEHFPTIRKRLAHLGSSLDPHAAFLLERGLKTLALRVRHQNHSALAMARYLDAHEAVRAVHYPGLETHPSHARASAWFNGCGGVLALELKGGEEAALEVIDALSLFAFAPSLGGPETLVTLPARTSHATLTASERGELGITDGLIRISVGVEATDDLIADLERALG